MGLFGDIIGGVGDIVTGVEDVVVDSLYSGGMSLPLNPSLKSVWEGFFYWLLLLAACILLTSIFGRTYIIFENFSR